MLAECLHTRRLAFGLVGVVVLMLLGAVPEAQADEVYLPQGLMPVRDFQPIQGLSLQMSGESILPLNKGEFAVRLHVSESSTILQETTPNATAILKLNQLRSALDLRYGLLPHTEVGIEIASLYNNAGGLDGLITAVEHLLIHSAPIRESLKHTGFAYVLTRHGQTVLQGTNGAYGLTDMVLSSKTLLVAEKSAFPGIALRLAVKLPTGDQSRGFGTSVVDLGIGLAAQKALLARLVLYQNVNGIFPTGHYIGFGLRPYLTSITGVEIMVTPKLSITGQFDYYQSPFHGTGLKLLDHAVTEGVLAFGYRFTPELLWQFYAVENLDFTRDAAPDFTLATVITYRAGRL
jgi:uncharacterized protein DUF3187